MTTNHISIVDHPGMTPLDLVGPLQVMAGLEVAEAAFDTAVRHRRASRSTP